jgi:predicted oxidoreductase
VAAIPGVVFGTKCGIVNTGDQKIKLRVGEYDFSFRYILLWCSCFSLRNMNSV